MATRHIHRTVGIGIAVAIAYIAAGRLGFRVAFVAEQVTTVWAPTGIAEAALLLWGLGLWPAIWLAAFAVNAATHAPLWTAAGIATGNTLEAVVAAWALSRIVGFDPAIRRTRDAMAFIGLAAAASTTISATVGVTILCAAGVQPWSRYWELWPDWWLGDALGALVVAPVLLTTLRAQALRRRDLIETAWFVLLAMAITAIVFGSWATPTIAQSPLAFVMFPFVMIAAVRWGQPATAIVVFGTAAVTVWNTVQGYGPFVSGPVHERLILLQVFIGVLASSGLLLAAAIAERRTIEGRRAAANAAGGVLADSVSLEEAAPRILRSVCTNLGWQFGALWSLDRAAGRLLCVAVWPDDGKSAKAFTALTKTMTFPVGLGLPGRVWSTGQATWVEDVVDDPNFPRASVARQEGFHGAFAFPIRLDNEILGVVEFFNQAVAVPDEDLLTTMAAMGNQIGQFISRKRVEAAVAEGQTRTRAILESALDAIISMDHNGMITEFNMAAERMFGHRRDDVLGRELAMLIIPQSLRDSHRQGLHNYLHTGVGPFIERRVETTATRRDGHEFPVEVSITRVPTDPPIFTGFVRDMTERAEAERERRRLLELELAARREAESANRAKDEFLATLSHELRTPLNAIVGWTRMLLEGTMEEATVQRALRIIDRNAQAQVQLVADILDVSRIITGKLTLDIRPVDLGSIIGTVIDGVRPAAEAKRIRVQPALAANARLITGDPQRLQQIVWNLISNAMKFTPQGGSIDVEVTECGDAAVCIKVTDSGVGIAPEFLPHVFERFRQADSSSTREHGGLGLGLAIVRHLVELHGGTVRAESPGADKGAAFIVQLPRLIAEERDAMPAQTGPSAADPGRPLSSEWSLSGCRVLVVEDDDDARELMAAVLGRSGAEVALARSVDEARESLNRHWPDVLLSDVGLVRENGYVLIREIRKLEANGRPHLPAAAVTAYARDEDRQRALAAGFDIYLAKPILPSAIVEAVLSLWK